MSSYRDGVRLSIVAYGRPITQGSKTRTRWGMRDDNGDTLKPWREAVKTAALQTVADTGWPRAEAPVAVWAAFTFDRPAGHFGSGRNAGVLRASAPIRPANVRSGDIDKLLRALLDACTDAGVWRDDAQVVDVAAGKFYVGHPEALHIPGVRVTVWPVAS